MWVFFEKKYISRSPRLYVVNKLTTFVVLFSFLIVSDHTLLNFVKKSSKSFCVIDNYPAYSISHQFPIFVTTYPFRTRSSKPVLQSCIFVKHAPHKKLTSSYMLGIPEVLLPKESIWYKKCCHYHCIILPNKKESLGQCSALSFKKVNRYQTLNVAACIRNCRIVW